MTEFELLEVIDNYSTQQMMFTTLFFTLVSAFLVTVHLVGQNLTRVEAVIVSFVYLVWICFLPWGQNGMSRQSANAINQLVSMNSDFVLSNPDTIVMVSSGFMSFQYLTIVASLCFMWRVRHSKTE